MGYLADQISGKSFPVNSRLLHGSSSPATIQLPRLSPAFLRRIFLVAVAVMLAHTLEWRWLRFLTSEAILRLSMLTGLTGARFSFDTLSMKGEFFEFVVTCTFVDVFVGSIPLLWDLQKSAFRNGMHIVAAGVVFFGFNIVRLEIGQLLYLRSGVPYVVAHDIVGGFAYFAIWLAMWHQRTWRVFDPVGT